jgi:7,8-dihydroneopterin aldolase/epimerase/oxygenase
MDTLNISALSVSTHIGVHAWEQRIKQTLLIDISIACDFSHCNDDIANTIDYERLCHLVTAYVESNSFQLIETVAQHISTLIRDEFSVKEFQVAVSKPHAIKNAKNVQVVCNYRETR